jgi:hypothetical protein
LKKEEIMAYRHTEEEVGGRIKTGSQKRKAAGIAEKKSKDLSKQRRERFAEKREFAD